MVARAGREVVAKERVDSERTRDGSRAAVRPFGDIVKWRPATFGFGVARMVRDRQPSIPGYPVSGFRERGRRRSRPATRLRIFVSGTEATRRRRESGGVGGERASWRASSARPGSPPSPSGPTPPPTEVVE
jgi:hypothetical protein